MDLVSQFWINWLTAILFAALLVVELIFLPETLYPRNHMLKQMPATSGIAGATDIEKVGASGDSSTADLARTKKLSFLNLKPVPGLRHPRPWDSLLRFSLTFKFLTVSIAVGIYCFAWYWWILSIITMIPVAYVQYSPQIQGLFFLGLILGTLFSEIFCSGRLSDFIVAKLAKKNNSIRVAEMRLWLAYPATLLSTSELNALRTSHRLVNMFVVGLIIWGISIDKMYHWIVGQIAFFLCKSGK